MTISCKAYWQLLRRYLAPQIGMVFCMAFSIFIIIGLQVIGPQIIRSFIDLAKMDSRVEDLIWRAFLFISVSLLQQFMQVLATYWGARVAWTATNALRTDLIDHLLKLDLGFHKAHTPGEIIERVDGDVNALADFFSVFTVKITGSFLLLLSVLFVLCVEDIWLGLIFLSFILFTILMLGWLRSFATLFLQEDRERSASFYGYMSEVMAAVEDLRSCGAVLYAMRRFYEHLRTWMPIRLRAETRRNAVWIFAVLTFALGDAIAYGFGGGLYLRGAISLGTVYMIIAYVALLQGPIETIRAQFQSLQRADASISRIMEILAIKSKLNNGGKALPIGALSVEFRDICFKYEDSLKAARYQGEESSLALLKDISFKLLPRRVLGIVGPTGSGKSTLARLLCRLYDPQKGNIYLGGVNLRYAALESVRSKVGLVTQEVQIFEASLRDNITFFNHAISDERVMSILEFIGLKAWYGSLANGLDTLLSANSLSAGEAQFLALARVFVKDPGLVILDEASSRLDPVTEKLLEQALDKLLVGRTAIIIAHRFQTLEKVDDILVMGKDGQIEEYGSREQLAAVSNSLYAKLRYDGLGGLE